MGEYNYSPMFLKANEDLVQQLINLAQAQDVAEASFESINEARRFRNLVLNLKRSLALNQPELAFVHNVLRTKTARDETGMWVIRIGPEMKLLDAKSHKLRGARSTMVQALTNTLVLPEVDKADGPNYLKLMAQLSISGQYEEVLIQKPLPQAALDYLATYSDGGTGKGFEIVETQPFTKLRVVDRTNASA